MGTTSLLIIGGQVLTLFFQLGNYFMRSFDATRRRFLLLSLCFTIFNALWFTLFLLQEALEEVFKHTLVASGALLLAALFYRAVKMEIATKGIAHFSLKPIVITVALSIILMGMASFYFFVEFPLVIAGFISACIAMVSLFTWQILGYFAASEFKTRSFNVRLFFIGLTMGLLCVGVLPLILAVEGIGLFGLGLANLAYLALFMAYLTFFLRQSSIENQVLNKLNFSNLSQARESGLLLSDQFEELTGTEKIVSMHMLKGLKHHEIAELLSVSTNTITSHASHIYKKTGCTGKQDFIRKYQHIANR
jgi:DNA-binding CsgD family transcriptional regulator